MPGLGHRRNEADDAAGHDEDHGYQRVLGDQPPSGDRQRGQQSDDVFAIDPGASAEDAEQSDEQTDRCVGEDRHRGQRTALEGRDDGHQTGVDGPYEPADGMGCDAVGEDTPEVGDIGREGQDGRGDDESGAQSFGQHLAYQSPACWSSKPSRSPISSS